MPKKLKSNFFSWSWIGLIPFFILSCYHGHGLSPTESISGRSSGISGKITFIGSWPDSTKEVRVAVFKKYPYGITDKDSLLVFVMNAYFTEDLVVSDTIPRFTSEYHYQMSLKPGSYAWVLVIWFPNITDYLTGVKELGAYYKNFKYSEHPTPVYTISSVVLEDIDMIADMDNIKREIPFF